LFSLIKDPERSLKPEEPNKKETTNREASSEDTKSQQQTSTLEAPQKPQNKSLIKPNKEKIF
jgi:hypothetical protein